MEEADVSTIEWYLAIDGKPDGPYTSREIDVKYRTNDLKSSTLAWKDGMSEWKAIFEIDELKKMLQETTDEITKEV